MLKAIETKYKGYRFRSRLEARWAVFFDTLGVLYDYEKEGYDLDGMRYLPDFWLPEYNTWIEIKGQPPSSEEIHKASQLQQLEGHPAVIFSSSFSDPVLPAGHSFFSEIANSSGGPAQDVAQWAICKHCEGALLILSCLCKCSVWTADFAAQIKPECDCPQPDLWFHHPLLYTAWKAARAARFEYGQHS